MSNATPLTSQPGVINPANSYRVGSIDLLRGLVMIFMALDHVRDYFHIAVTQYDPTDLAHTNTFLFLTRWVTHFCAPLFMFLSGCSAYLVGIRKGRRALARFLFTRGLWLVILEFTIVSFGWSFNFPPPSIDFLVIWALGISMIALAALIYLPWTAILTISLVMIFAHNLLDPITVSGKGADAVLWALFHQSNFFPYDGIAIFVGYPIIPWIGVMSLGYCFGRLYGKDVDASRRRRILLVAGIGSILLFVGIRLINKYGDPAPWTSQQTPVFTFLSFINVSKYPPSLLYLLITLGPALVFLAITERHRSWAASRISVIGRVPMFYYLVHLYLIHITAMFATYFCGFEPGDMVLTSWIAFEPKLQGYGFSLAITYAIWFVLIILLYFLCRWYDRYKKNHQYWWLSYL